MPRMFDVLRNKVDNTSGETGQKKEKKPKPLASENKEKKSDSEKKPLHFPKEILKNHKREEKKTDDRFSLASEKLISTMRKHGTDSHEKASEIYENALKTIKVLLVKIRTKENLDLYMPKIYEVLDNIFNQLVLGDSLLNNICEKKNETYYLPNHIINTLILSSALGLSMGFNKSRLNHIGLASVFYDVGLDALREIIAQPRKLTGAEYNLIKTHIDKSLEVVGATDAINEVVKDTIRMHHERVNGSGYPLGLKTDKINPYAKILGLADTYETLTHDRPHREGMNTHKAVTFLISSLKDNFDTAVTKIFVNKMSVYPIGSIVKLSTGEVARIISVRSGSPLRPVVMIIKNAYGEHVTERNIVDLSRQTLLFIREAL